MRNDTLGTSVWPKVGGDWEGGACEYCGERGIGGEGGLIGEVGGGWRSAGRGAGR